MPVFFVLLLELLKKYCFQRFHFWRFLISVDVRLNNKNSTRIFFKVYKINLSKQGFEISDCDLIFDASKVDFELKIV